MVSHLHSKTLGGKKNAFVFQGLLLKHLMLKYRILRFTIVSIGGSEYWFNIASVTANSDNFSQFLDEKLNKYTW